jgi:hypothetical protein
MRGSRLMLVLAAAAALAGCRTTATPEQQSTVRSGGETAPADLQLACATDASTRLNGGGNVLPISSARDPNGTYRVGLQLTAGQAVCVIDQNGVIQTIEKI